MVNLISNAVKFCEADRGYITVRMRAKAAHLLVQVEDNGIGIKPENLNRIFEPFHQIKNPTKGRPVGTGIGLTFCKLVVEAHQGSIWVDSRPGEGSTFSFTLPY